MSFAIVLLLFALEAGAQLATSSVSGMVSSADGTGLAGVTVTLKNQESGQVRVAATSDNGAYSVAGVKPGVYTITFDLEGFKSVGREAVELRVGQEARLNVTLDLGEVE
jgi:hypothetical protein